MKIQLKGREIPRNEAGDPAFTKLGLEGFVHDTWIITKGSLLAVFTQEEIVELVNRAIYQLEYQHASHKRRGQEQRDREKRLREKVKELFHTSWLKATPEQIRKAQEEVDKGG